MLLWALLFPGGAGFQGWGKMRQLVLGSLVGILSLSMSASAGERSWYVALEGGLEFEGGSNAGSYANASNEGTAAFATFGTKISNNISLEGEFGYRSTGFDSYYFSMIHVDVHQYSVMVNAVYEVPVTKELSLDFGVGLGVDQVQLDDGYRPSAGDTDIAGQLKLGLNLAIGEGAAVTLDYRYLRTFNGEFYLDGPSGKGLRDDTVTVGLKFDL